MSRSTLAVSEQEPSFYRICFCKVSFPLCCNATKALYQNKIRMLSWSIMIPVGRLNMVLLWMIDVKTVGLLQ